MNSPHTVLFAIVTVAGLGAATSLLIFTKEATLHTLAIAIIGNLLGMWVPSPVQPTPQKTS